jgi:hypothetical protein
MYPSEFSQGVFWTLVVIAVILFSITQTPHCAGSLAEYLHLGVLEYCTGP